MAANISFDYEPFNNMRKFTGAISEGEENVIEVLKHRLGAIPGHREILHSQNHGEGFGDSHSDAEDHRRLQV